MAEGDRQLWRSVTQALGKMYWFRGLRAGISVSVPLLMGELTDNEAFGWAALGGFETILADQGGPYKTRLASMATVALGGSIGCTLAMLAAGKLAWVLPLTLISCFIWTYLIVLGQPFSTGSILVQVLYICGFGAADSTLHRALIRGLFVLGGGLWAMVLSLLVWPLDPYRPARMAVAACYSELASFLLSLRELSRTREQDGERWQNLISSGQKAVRNALELARNAGADVRSEASGSSFRSQHLTVLRESADLILGRTVALAAHLEITIHEDPSPCAARARASLANLIEVEQWIAEQLRAKTQQAAQSGAAMFLRMDRLPAEVTACMPLDDLQGQFLVKQIADAAQNLQTAVESTLWVRLGKRADKIVTKALDEHVGAEETKQDEGLSLARSARHRVATRTRDLATAPPAPIRRAPMRLRSPRLHVSAISKGGGLTEWLEPLAANWSWRSLQFRHALRVGLVVALDEGLLNFRTLNHGYWLPLTSLIVLQPHVSGTLRKSLQRVGGTVAGGILAALLAVHLRSAGLTALALFPIGGLAVAVMPISYTLFCFFLTPTFVLAFMPFPGDWQLAGVRVLNTALGAAIAMAAMALFFPALERSRLGRVLGRSIAANRLYLERLKAVWQAGEGADEHELSMARRTVGLAHNASEESMERVLLEQLRRRTAAIEAAMTFVVFIRRFSSTITGLASLGGEWEWKQSDAVQQRLAKLAHRLELIHATLDESQTVNKLPEQFGIDPILREWDTEDAEQQSYGAENHSGEVQLSRLERQTGVLARELSTMAADGLTGVRGIELSGRTAT